MFTLRRDHHVRLPHAYLSLSLSLFYYPQIFRNNFQLRPNHRDYGHEGNTTMLLTKIGETENFKLNMKR